MIEYKFPTAGSEACSSTVTSFWVFVLYITDCDVYCRIIEIGCGVRFVNLRSRSVVCLVMESVTCIIAFMR